jgi:peptidylprolyl isomerase
MDRRRSRFVPGLCFASERLERRAVPSAAGSAGGLSRSSAEVAAAAARQASTHLSLAVTAGTLGQPITFTATVRAGAAAGAPAGTVNILDHGRVIQTLSFTPTTSASGQFASSTGTAVLTQPPGGAAYFFGKHQVSAVFVPKGGFARSTANQSFTVSEPAYTTLAGGVQVATIAPGSGPQIQSGQTANVLYTGYLAKNGKIFDDLSAHGEKPMSFTLGAGQLIPGFDAGTADMQAGETRVILIPPAEGYGAAANGPIPANSTLIFVVTLQSISSAAPGA